MHAYKLYQSRVWTHLFIVMSMYFTTFCWYVHAAHVHIMDANTQTSSSVCFTDVETWPSATVITGSKQ